MRVNRSQVWNECESHSDWLNASWKERKNTGTGENCPRSPGNAEFIGKVVLSIYISLKASRLHTKEGFYCCSQVFQSGQLTARLTFAPSIISSWNELKLLCFLTLSKLLNSFVSEASGWLDEQFSLSLLGVFLAGGFSHLTVPLTYSKNLLMCLSLTFKLTTLLCVIPHIFAKSKIPQHVVWELSNTNKTF